MARIAGVPVRAAGLRVRLVYFFTGRNFARLTDSCAYCFSPGSGHPPSSMAVPDRLAQRRLRELLCAWRLWWRTCRS
jgi:hypothetical protein